MSTRERIEAEELHAYMDGELDPSRQAEVALIVAQDPDLAAQVAQFRNDKEKLARIYGGLVNKPLPRAWIEQIEKPAKPRRFSIPVMAALAASLAVLVVGGIELRNTLAPAAGDTVVAEALAARDNQVQPIDVVSAHAVSGTQADSRLVAQTLDMHVKVPDLTPMGYALRTIQVYPAVGDGRAVELIYRSMKNESFRLFVKHAPGSPRFDVFERDGVRVCVWQDEAVAAVMTGKMSAAEMQRLAALSYEGLEG